MPPSRLQGCKVPDMQARSLPVGWRLESHPGGRRTVVVGEGVSVHTHRLAHACTDANGRGSRSEGTSQPLKNPLDLDLSEPRSHARAHIHLQTHARTTHTHAGAHSHTDGSVHSRAVAAFKEVTREEFLLDRTLSHAFLGEKDGLQVCLVHLNIFTLEYYSFFFSFF